MYSTTLKQTQFKRLYYEQTSRCVSGTEEFHISYVILPPVTLKLTLSKVIFKDRRSLKSMY